jgi:hypothetical protein
MTEWQGSGRVGYRVGCHNLPCLESVNFPGMSGVEGKYYIVIIIIIIIIITNKGVYTHT